MKPNETRLANCRLQIDEIDRNLLELLKKRAQVVLQVGDIKRTAGASTSHDFYDPARERAILDKLVPQAAPFSTETIQRIFKEIIQSCRTLESEVTLSQPRVNTAKPTLAIIGFGRFGQLWSHFFAHTHEVWVHDSRPIKDPAFRTVPLAEAGKAETVIIAVPLRQMEKTMHALAPHLAPHTVVMDVGSVKSLPAMWMAEAFPTTTTIIATHPLFGPDSFATSERRIAVHLVQGDETAYSRWKTYFTWRGLTLLEVDPDTHDQVMAGSQGLTHIIGRTLNAFGARASLLDTQSYQALLQVMNQTCKDSPQLFQDLIHLNPHSEAAIEAFAKAFGDVMDTLA
ncbi:MAG: hypothetical protein A3J38_08355 [Gammaproteobacteria bacterium RIFCSPHIGHO2_12_FULL_45_9]|nr:MAG: hypothetical protein A3J38_08355 [Gammaproteobacteria bacterium RIFCSPHIGHO2_12_FULL_45_9]